MSAVSQNEIPFLKRFHSVWSRLRRVQLAQVATCTVLLCVAGWGLVAWADYQWELDRSARLAGLILVGTISGLFVVRALWGTIRSWSQPTTAAQIEQAFPELGQSVRTTVQFGALPAEQVRSEGVASSLVTALSEQTDQRTRPLGLDVIVPTKQLWIAACGLGAVVLLLLGAVSADWQWRNATSRALLSETPYTELDLLPGDVTVEEARSVAITVQLTGRTTRDIQLFTRPAGVPDAEWLERRLEKTDRRDQESADQKKGDAAAASNQATATTAERSQSDRPQVQYVVNLNKLTKDMEYRATAGDLATPTFRIGIRRPLKLVEVRVDLTPPAYTGQETSTVLDGNLSVLQGSMGKFVVSFDKPVKSAALVFAPRKQSRDEDVVPKPETVPLAIENHAARKTGQDGTETYVAAAELTLTEDRNYSIVAEAADGTVLPDNKFRIRVREDQPPQVSFEEPDDGIEVHTLAELPMRVRIRDDYGLSRAGIIFQVNNEQEIPLESRDFEAIAAAAKEIESTGRISPTTQAALERVLPLEHFELTQKDSVMYFAYAEDNRPGQAQRTETDMRFIDIRPFKREFRIIDPDPMNGMGMGLGLKSLAELIQRQRFALNRTIQFEKRAAAGRKPDATSIDQLMKFETELAQATRDTALGLESRGFDDTELFYQAEAAMLQAVDSLSVAKWENATLQMRDALKYLVEQRDRAIETILKNPDRAQVAAQRAFDRMQAQKLRRPKSDKEEARELIRRLLDLANQETTVSESLQSGEEPLKPEQPDSEPKKADDSKADTNATDSK